MMETLLYAPGWTSAFEWAIILGFVMSFFVSFFMGANDCANAWGTSVGSGVLRPRDAYVLMAIFNTLGAMLLGFKDTETIRHGIFEVDIYDVYSRYNRSDENYALVANCSQVNGTSHGMNVTECARYTSAEFLLGELSALTGSALWKMIAIIAKKPVSATQSIVGASVGFSVVLKGTASIKWHKIRDIVFSWIISPLLAGIIAAAFYLIIKFAVMRRKDPFEAALQLMPVFFWFTLAVNLFSVFYHGSKYLHFDSIPWWGALIISNVIGVIVALVMHFFASKKMRKMYGNSGEKNQDVQMAEKKQRKCEEGNIKEEEELEDPRAVLVFNSLQILSASFLSFSHGANDTASSVGPLVGMWLVYQTGTAAAEAASRTDIQLIILFGAVSVVIGFICLGHRIMRVVGKEITKISAASGFATELGAAFTVLLASKIGIPVSTTYCAIGAVVGVGCVRSNVSGVQWRTFASIVVGWVVTVPLSAAAAAVAAYVLVHFVLGSV